MGEGNSESYGKLAAILLAQYLQSQQRSSLLSSVPLPTLWNEDAYGPHYGGSILGKSGLQGGVSPAMIEILKQMQQPRGGEPQF